MKNEVDWNEIHRVGPLVKRYLEASEALSSDLQQICGGPRLDAEDLHDWALAVQDVLELERLLRSICPQDYELTWFETEELEKGLP